VHDELAALQRAAQVGHAGQPRGRVVIVFGCVHRRVVGLLAQVHRDVGVADQGLDVHSVPWMKGDPDTGLDLERELPDRHLLR